MSTVGEQTSELRHHIDKAVDVLVEEFGHHQSRESIQRIMDDSVSQLVGSAQVETSCPRSHTGSRGSG